MDNEGLTPKSMIEPLIEECNKIYNQAIDHCIGIVNEIKYGSRNEPLKGVTEAIKLITNELSKLKKDIK